MKYRSWIMRCECCGENITYKTESGTTDYRTFLKVRHNNLTQFSHCETCNMQTKQTLVAYDSNDSNVTGEPEGATK